ncbi:hypothetical protein NKH82_17975 [Mesorhizobium sp. M0915]|uniref:hypothetical protein n=1 Tax=Mesorhizobium sp. M0915 TaxID=2957027 RepID=UPI003335BD7A
MPSVDNLVPAPKPHVDAGVMKECAGVVDIPHRFVPYDELVRLHATDRQSLGDCKRGKHAAILTIKALLK